MARPASVGASSRGLERVQAGKSRAGGGYRPTRNRSDCRAGRFPRVWETRTVEPLTAVERTIMLRALFELAVTASSYDEDDGRYDRADHRIRPEQIADLVRKLGGDPDVPLFGADDLRD